MREQSGDHIPGESQTVSVAFANPCRGEGSKFAQRNLHGAVVRFHDAFVIGHQCRQRNGFGRGKGEVVKDAAVGRSCAVLFANGISSLRQGIARLRILIFAQCQEIGLTGFSIQAK